MNQPQEWEIAKTITDYCDQRKGSGKLALLAHVKQKYGLRKTQNFKTFGYGGFSYFIRKWKIIIEKPAKLKPTQAELIEVIQTSIQRTGQLNWALTDIREKFGHGPFGQFGFGTFKEFVKEHSDIIHQRGRSSKIQEIQEIQVTPKKRDFSPKRPASNQSEIEELRAKLRQSLFKQEKQLANAPQYQLFPVSLVPLIPFIPQELSTPSDKN